MVDIKAEIDLPEGFQAEVKEGKILIIKGDQELARALPKRNFKATISANKITIEVDDLKYRALIGTFRSHIKNMIKGLQEPYVYKLKVCSSHFPMSVELKGRELLIQNFLGEHEPRKVKLPEGVNVEVEGEVITVKSADKELAGLTAGNIEKATYLSNKTEEFFQTEFSWFIKLGEISNDRYKGIKKKEAKVP